jgi:hypothetical protein
VSGPEGGGACAAAGIDAVTHHARAATPRHMVRTLTDTQIS